MTDEKDWYNNKELYEMIQGLKEDFQDFRSDLKTTREVIKKYNGLRSDLAEVIQKVKSIEERSAGRNQVLEIILKWGGWIVAIFALYLKWKGAIG